MHWLFKKKKHKPMSLNRINKINEELGLDYRLEEENGEIVMVKQKKGD